MRLHSQESSVNETCFTSAAIFNEANEIEELLMQSITPGAHAKASGCDQPSDDPTRPPLPEKRQSVVRMDALTCEATRKYVQRVDRYLARPDALRDARLQAAKASVAS